jgi:hypothetical protein
VEGATEEVSVLLENQADNPNADWPENSYIIRRVNFSE